MREGFLMSAPNFMIASQQETFPLATATCRILKPDSGFSWSTFLTSSWSCCCCWFKWVWSQSERPRPLSVLRKGNTCLCQWEELDVCMDVIGNSASFSFSVAPVPAKVEEEASVQTVWPNFESWTAARAVAVTGNTAAIFHLCCLGPISVTARGLLLHFSIFPRFFFKCST